MDAAFRVQSREGDEAGIGLMGYTWYSLSLGPEEVLLKTGTAREISRWVPERISETVLARFPRTSDRALFRMRIRDGRVSFFFGEGPDALRPAGGAYPMACGGWTGARPGIFALNTLGAGGGFADFSSVRISPR